MAAHHSTSDTSRPSPAQEVRHPGGAAATGEPGGARPVLDPVDHKILAALVRDARIPNNALAAEVGIAPSTCLGRVRALREADRLRIEIGVITADDPGLPQRPHPAKASRGGDADLSGQRVVRDPRVPNEGGQDLVVHRIEDGPGATGFTRRGGTARMPNFLRRRRPGGAIGRMMRSHQLNLANDRHTCSYFAAQSSY